MYVFFFLLNYKLLGGDDTQPYTDCLPRCHLCYLSHCFAHKRRLIINEWWAARSHFIKRSKSHNKSFGTSREVLCFLTFGVICLLNLHADSLACDTGSCGELVFNHFSQDREIEGRYIYRGLCPQNIAAQSYISNPYHKWVRQDKPTWRRK